MTDRLVPRDRRRHAATGSLMILIAFLGAQASSGEAARRGFEVGQRWEYRHEGPRPGSMEPNAIDGERILRVISVVEEPEGRHWVIEERFTQGPNATGRLHVSPEQMLLAMEIQNPKGEVARLRYDPPVPYRALGLQVGEKRTIETALKMEAAEFSLPATIVLERLADETIAVPAGEFAGCTHVRTTTVSTANLKIAKVSITEERDQWYHPSVNGLVKEVYRRGPAKLLTWARPGYTATSVLTAFGTEETRTGAAPATPVGTNDRERDGPGQPPRRALSWGRTGVILLGTLGILAIGGLLWARRTAPR